MNFFAGNQYCKINGKGDIEDGGDEYYWQMREVFNHIAPLVETRLAKFSRISPSVCVRPESDDDEAAIGADCAEKLLTEVFTSGGAEETVRKVTLWSEICGTGFYKIIWDNDGGAPVGEFDGKPVYEGAVKILPVSPFEIFPDSLYTEDVAELKSIIHAKAVPVNEIFDKYGVTVAGDEVGVYDLCEKSFSGEAKSTLKNSAIVIEKYERPSAEFPNGRLITVSGGKLLYYGELPYKNGDKGARNFPFVKQESQIAAGRFFGTSIIERLIPVQRAYNAVKNRKHEFMNRLSMGVLKVEDGSVDVDDLAEGGLCPGKVLVYRQGSTPPEIMNGISMPADFNGEEEKLLGEFVSISGVSDVSSSRENGYLKSASALTLLIEQDNEKLTGAAERIRRSYLLVAKQVIRLYAQFITGVMAIKTSLGLNRTKLSYVTAAALRSDDVYLENDNEMLYSDSQKKETVYKLIESGLLTDEKGNMEPSVKSKILSVLGYKELDGKKGVDRLQEEKAQRENALMRKQAVSVEEIDDDRIHVTEHTRYVLGEYEELSEAEKTRYYEHIGEHKKRAERNENKGE